MIKPTIISLCIFASCAISFALPSAAQGDDGNTETSANAVTKNSDTDTKTSAEADTKPSDNTGAEPSESSKKKVDQRTESDITAEQRVILDLEHCYRHLHRTAGDLINESTQQQLQVVATADDVGPILMTPPLVGVMPAGGFLPCRKKFIDLFMNQLHDIVPMAVKETEEIELDDKARTAIASDALETLTSTSEKLKDRVKSLDNLTKGPDYDNEAIYKESKALQEQAATGKRSCRALLKELKRQDKTVVKEMHLLEKQDETQEKNEKDGKPESNDSPTD